MFQHTSDSLGNKEGNPLWWIRCHSESGFLKLLYLFKTIVALLNQYQANNNQKSMHIKMTGYPRVLVVIFVVASTFFQENKKLSQWAPKWCPWGVKWNWKLPFPPPFLESLLHGENSCLWKSSVWGTLYAFPAVSFSDEMYKSNTIDKSHVWSLFTSAWATVISKLSSFTFSS